MRGDVGKCGGVMCEGVGGVMCEGVEEGDV